MSLAFLKDLFEQERDVDDDVVLNIVSFETPLGVMFAGATNQGLCLLDFDNPDRVHREFKDLIKHLKAKLVPGENSHLVQVQQELKEYFSGKGQVFNVPLQMPGTEFRQSVWRALQEIPYGKTWSYQQQADALKNSKAVRAVASANGQNRLSIIVPCHRVIGSNGKLTGYAGGLHRKQWLLDLEKESDTA